jgi:hypothetical protein
MKGISKKIGGCFIGIVVITLWFQYNSKTFTSTSLSDQVLLALIKNDLVFFEQFIEDEGDIHENLPAVDGQVLSIAEGISYYGRTDFARALHRRKIRFATEGVLKIAIKKNNPDLFKELMTENIDPMKRYGSEGWTLLHMASAWCSDKVSQIIFTSSTFNQDAKAADGSTPLTLAADKKCLSILAFYKTKGFNFKSKDAAGRSALSILLSKKDHSLSNFLSSVNGKKILVAKVAQGHGEVNFYKKRKVPKDQIVDYASILEPEDRPLESSDTAEYSEFAD